MDNQLKKKTDTKAVIFSDAWWSYFYKNWWRLLLKLVLILMIFWLIWMAITPLINFSSFFKWFRKGGGSQYKNCFRFSQLAYYTYFPLYFYIGSYINKSETYIDSAAQAEMLLYLLSNYSDKLGMGNPLTPKALCESIIPDGLMSEETFKAYNKYATANKRTKLKSQEWPSAEDWTTWQIIFFLWGAGGIPNSCNNQDMATGKKSPPCLTDRSPVPASENQPSKFPGNINCWITASDNFLWQGYGIPAQSPLLIAFQSQSATVCTTNLTPDPNAMRLLLGDQNAGAHDWSGYGWWGMIKNMGDTTSKFDDLKNMIWSTVELQGLGGGATAGKTDPTTCITSAASKGVGAGISGAMGVGMMADALPFIETPVGWIAVVSMASAALGVVSSPGVLSGCSSPSSSSSPSS